MAHLVTNQINQKGDLVLKGVPAWHGLGTVINNEELTTAEVLQYSGLDFEVAKMPNIHRLPDNTEITSKESFFTYRTDKNIILGSSVGKVYTPIQNIEALNLMDILKEEGKIHWETAGALDNGREIFIAAKVDSQIKINGFDDVVPYIVISNSHDGKNAIRAYFTNIRVVCNNTLQASIRAAKTIYKIRHTTNAKDKIKDALELMGLAKKISEESSEAYQAMAKTKIKSLKFWEYIGNVFCNKEEINRILNGESLNEVITKKKRKVLDEVFEYAEVGIGQKEAGYTSNMWGAYNAVTGYFSNVKNYRKQEKRYDNLLFGKDNDIMTKALDLALRPEKIVPIYRKRVEHIYLN